MCLHVLWCHSGHQRTAYRSWFLSFNGVGPENQLGSNALNCRTVLLAQPSFFTSWRYSQSLQVRTLCLLQALWSPAMQPLHPGSPRSHLSLLSVIPGCQSSGFQESFSWRLCWPCFCWTLSLAYLSWLASYLSLVLFHLPHHSASSTPPFHVDLLCPWLSDLHSMQGDWMTFLQSYWLYPLEILISISTPNSFSLRI